MTIIRSITRTKEQRKARESSGIFFQILTGEGKHGSSEGKPKHGRAGNVRLKGPGFISPPGSDETRSNYDLY